MNTHEYILRLGSIENPDIRIIGGKAMSLNHMINSGFPVPDGNVISSVLFKNICEKFISNKINHIVQNTNYDDFNEILKNSKKIQHLINSMPIDDDFLFELHKSVKNLKGNRFAVRSSASEEDSQLNSWAGQLESYLNIDNANMVIYLKKCFASLYTPRAMAYRYRNNLLEKEICMSVIIQEMVQSEVAGVCFTIHPVTKDKNEIIIEAGLGLGEAVVSGIIMPDTYIYNKKKQICVSKNIGHQKIKVINDSFGIVKKILNEDEGSKQKLSDQAITELAKICCAIEKYYGRPQDIEWAYKDNKFYITQSRPITTL